MSDLSPMPKAVTEEPQLHPGGVDAIVDNPDQPNLARDLDPSKNPAVEDESLPGLTQSDDKKQGPTGAADQEAGTKSEEGSPPAGQVAEDGTPEPPA